MPTPTTRVVGEDGRVRDTSGPPCARRPVGTTRPAPTPRRTPAPARTTPAEVTATARRARRSPATRVTARIGGEERDEARLRVREVEAGAAGTPRSGSPIAARIRSSQRRTKTTTMPRHEVAPVDARVVEDRRDPEERRVGVRGLEVVGEEEPVAPLLPEPDRRGDGRRGEEDGREAPAARLRQPCLREDGDEDRAGEEEEEEVDRAPCVRPATRAGRSPRARRRPAGGGREDERDRPGRLPAGRADRASASPAAARTA